MSSILTVGLNAKDPPRPLDVSGFRFAGPVGGMYLPSEEIHNKITV
jgi:hypothetical protein